MGGRATPTNWGSADLTASTAVGVSRFGRGIGALNSGGGNFLRHFLAVCWRKKHCEVLCKLFHVFNADDGRFLFL